MSLLYSYNLLCVYSFDFPEVNNSHMCKFSDVTD